MPHPHPHQAAVRPVAAPIGGLPRHPSWADFFRRAAWRAVARWLVRPTRPVNRPPARLAVEAMERRMMPAMHLFDIKPYLTYTPAGLGQGPYEGTPVMMNSGTLDGVPGDVPPNPIFEPGNFYAVLNWGDDTPSEAARMRIFHHNAQAGWYIEFDGGPHEYKHPRLDGQPYTVTLDLYGPDFSPSGSIQTYSGGHSQGLTTITVVDAPIHATGREVTVVENKPVPGPLGWFTDENKYGHIGEFSATYTYDEEDLPADLSGGPGRAVYTVEPSDPLYFYHYNDRGPLPEFSPMPPVPFRVKSIYTSEAWATLNVIVKDAALHAHVYDPPEVEPPDTVLELEDYGVGWFSDENRDDKEIIGEYTATIYWGDGWSSLGEILAMGPDGKYPVLGSHTYLTAGEFLIQMHVVSTGGSEAWDTGETEVRVPGDSDAIRLLAGDGAGRHVIPVVEAGAELFSGALRLRHELDFDLSPGTSVGGSPALLYNSATVSPRPIIHALYRRDPEIEADALVTFVLKWYHGDPTPDVQYESFTLPPGELSENDYHVTFQLESPITSTGLYTYSVESLAEYVGTTYTFATAAHGTYAVAATNDSPYGDGWLMAGVDRLYEDTLSGDVIWVYPNGESGHFKSSGLGTYSAPPWDFGTLTKSGGTFQYTSTHQTVREFDSAGHLTRVVDPHSLALTYTYDGDRLTGVQSPDGGLTTLNYSSGKLESIDEPGGRTVDASVGGSTLGALTDANEAHRTFSYADGRLTHDDWGPVSATFVYDGDTDRLSELSFGAGTEFDLTPAEVFGLNQVTLQTERPTHLPAFWTEPVNGLSTYVLHLGGGLARLRTPDGKEQRWDVGADELVGAYRDKAGRPTHYFYDESGNHTETVYTDGTSSSFEYDDTFNFVTLARDENGHAWEYEYNSTADRTLATDPAGNSSEFTYDAGLLRTAEDPLHNVTTYSYDTHRRVTQTEDPLHRFETFTYDAAGNLTTAVNGEGKVTTTTYDARNQLVDRKVGLAANRTTFAYDAVGNLTATTDPNGHVTATAYDGRLLRARVTEAVGTAAQAVTTFAYDANMRLTETRDPSNQATTYAYDSANNLTSSKAPLHQPRTMRYDAVGNLTRLTDERGGLTTHAYDARDRRTVTQDPLTHQTGTSYDAVGNATRTVDALGHESFFEYDARDRLTRTTDPTGKSDDTRYDAAGNVTKTVDKRGYTTSYSYDAANQRTLVTYPDQPPATFAYAPAVTTFAYDRAGQLTQVRPPVGAPVTYAYDDAGRQTATTDGVHTVTTAYDAAGNSTQITDARPQPTSLYYDARNRVTVTVDPSTARHTTAYDVSGRVTEVVGPAAAGAGQTAQHTLYYYDAAGQLTKTVDALTQVTTSLYDGAGDLTRVEDRRGQPTLYAYDLAGRRTLVTDPLAHSTLSAFDPRGQVTRIVDANSRVSTMAYDRLGRLQSVEDPSHRFEQYGYDAEGNRTWVTDGRTRTDVAYDLVGRVIRVAGAAGGVAVTGYDAVGNVTETVDPNGNPTDYFYDPVGRRTLVVDTAGQGTTYAYDASDNLVSVEDPLHRVVTYGYDALNRQVGVTEVVSRSPGGSVDTAAWPSEYDAAGNLWQTADPYGAITTYGYDALNRRVTARDAAGTATTAYDAEGNVTATQDARGNTRGFAYDAAGRMTAAADAYTQSTGYGYDNVGNLTREVDRKGRVTTYLYDGADRLTVTHRPLNGYHERQFDASGNLTYEADYQGRHTSYAYDLENRMVARASLNGQEEYFYYDRNANQTIAVDPDGRATQSFYDPRGLLTLVAAGDRELAGFAYDAAGQRTLSVDSRGQSTTTAYDERGLSTLTVDPLGHYTATEFDRAHRVTAVVTNDGQDRALYAYDAAGRRTGTRDGREVWTTFTFDAVGNVVEVRDGANNRTTFAYDAENRLTLTTDPNQARTTAAYDVDGSQTLVQDRPGRARGWTYDAAGRVSGELWFPPNGVQEIERVTYGYDDSGLLVTAANGTGTVTYGYDAAGRLVGDAQPTGFRVTYTLDGVGHHVGVVDSKGGLTTSVYDALAPGTLQSRSFGDGTRTMTFATTFDPDGRLTGVYRGVTDPGATANYGSGAVLPTRATYAYDAAGRVTYIGTDVHSSGMMGTFHIGAAAVQYGYDAADRVTWEGDLGSATAATYAYDAASQVTGDTGTAHGYDAAGNRTDVGYAHGTGNRMSTGGGWTYTYDAAGNRTLKEKAGEVWAYGYDHNNHLVSATKSATVNGAATYAVSFAYDAVGRRTSRSEDADGAGATLAYVTEQYGYDGQDAVADLTGAGAVTARRAYLDGRDRLVARVDGGGRAWYATDRLGSVRRVEQDAGTALDTIAYDGFGQVASESTPASGDRYKFTAQEWEGGVGAYYYNARFYDPLVGRFFSEDQSGFSAGDPNLYRYVGNNATNATDPTGLFGIDDLKQLYTGTRNPVAVAGVFNDVLSSMAAGARQQAQWLDQAGQVGEMAGSIMDDYTSTANVSGYAGPFMLAKQLMEIGSSGLALGASGMDMMADMLDGDWDQVGARYWAATDMYAGNTMFTQPWLLNGSTLLTHAGTWAGSGVTSAIGQMGFRWDNPTTWQPAINSGTQNWLISLGRVDWDGVRDVAVDSQWRKDMRAKGEQGHPKAAEYTKRGTRAVDEFVLLPTYFIGLGEGTAAARLGTSGVAQGMRAGRPLAAAGARSSAAERPLLNLFKELQTGERLAPRGVAGQPFADVIAAELDAPLDLASKIKPKPGYFDVAAHGNPDGIIVRLPKSERFPDGLKVAVSPEEAATIIRRMPGYTEGTPIRLIVCDTAVPGTRGVSPYGARLAQEMKVPILAPTRKVWPYPDGTLEVLGGKYIDGVLRPMKHVKGQWMPFGDEFWGKVISPK